MVQGPVVKMPVGGKIERVLIEKHKGRKGITDVFSIIGEEVIGAKTHFEQDLNYFYCFDGLCCEFSLPSIRYILPIYLYPSPNINNRLGAFRFLSLPEDAYDNQLLAGAKLINGKVHYGKWQLSCTDENFQKNTIILLGQADWHTNEQTKAFVLKEKERYDKWIVKSIARRITQQDYIEMTGRSVPSDVGAFLEGAGAQELDALAGGSPPLLEVAPAIETGSAIVLPAGPQGPDGGPSQGTAPGPIPPEGEKKADDSVVPPIDMPDVPGPSPEDLAGGPGGDVGKVVTDIDNLFK